MAGSGKDDKTSLSGRSILQPTWLSRASTSTNDAVPGTAGSGISLSESDEEASAGITPADAASPSEELKSRSVMNVRDEGDDGSEPADETGEQAGMPMQKRRRVSRACDECRKKKIKCDGKQPCSHCAIYSYECTYDKPSNRRRNPAPQYIEAVEAKLHRAEMLLRKFMPDVDLNDPNLDPIVQQEFRSRERARIQQLQAAQGAQPKQQAEQEQIKDNGTQDAQILSMIETIGQLDLSDAGEWDFHGISSSAVFLRRMKEHFRGLLGNDYRMPFLPRPPRPRGIFSLDSPRFTGSNSSWDLSALPNIYDLPPKDKVKALCYRSLSCATCLLRVVHIPSFYEMLDRVYGTPVKSWDNEENRFLGLMYSVMALGCMYTVGEQSSSAPSTYKSALDEGLKYYASARLILQDIAECRDMTSLQALVFIILFLQASANLNGCYAFIGIALRSAIRMGLHRYLRHESITPIQDQTRRQVFHVIRQMDVYVSAILGFPMLLNDEDIDQPLPIEVNDEYITKDAVLSPPPNTPSFFQAYNANAKLMRILSRVVKNIYPLKGVEECVMNGERPNATYLISFGKIKGIEQDLQQWYEELPQYWRPSPEGPVEVIRVRTLLRFGYAHVQMILYRPFLHYVSPRLNSGKHIDERYYACAAAGISVSRNIVHIGQELKKQAALIGPYWFILYTEYFAIISLVFYVLENLEKSGAEEILKDANDGREFLASLAQRSIAAERVTNSLNVLFEQLPERLKKERAKNQNRPVPTKKRTLQGSKGDNVPTVVHAALQENIQPQRHSDELARGHIGLAGRDGAGIPHRGSFDAVSMQQGRNPGQNFASNMQGLVPLDLSSTAGGSETSQSSLPRNHQGFHGALTPGSMLTNSIYKLDAMMFPSEDPFAYPKQPAAEFVSHQRSQQVVDRQPEHHGGGQQHQEGMQYYMQDMYDDIEGQLLGPIPSYLVQQGQGPQNVDFPAPMFHHSNVLSAQHGQTQGRRIQQQQQQQRGLAEQQRDLDALLADPNFRGDWGDLLGNPPGSFRDM